MSDITEPYDIGIVLGPFIHVKKKSHNDYEIIQGETFRLNQAIQLYKQGKFKKILLSGNDNPEMTRTHLISLCIPPDDILIEDKSSNTYENALFSKQYLQRKGMLSKRLLLITSASHMRRAFKCFQKSGLKVTPLSVEIWTTCSDISAITIHDFIPHFGALGRWRNMYSEWASFLFFKIKGYI